MQQRLCFTCPTRNSKRDDFLTGKYEPPDSLSPFLLLPVRGTSCSDEAAGTRHPCSKSATSDPDSVKLVKFALSMPCMKRKKHTRQTNTGYLQRNKNMERQQNTFLETNFGQGVNVEIYLAFCHHEKVQGLAFQNYCFYKWQYTDDSQRNEGKLCFIACTTQL